MKAIHPEPDMRSVNGGRDERWAAIKARQEEISKELGEIRGLIAEITEKINIKNLNDFISNEINIVEAEKRANFSREMHALQRELDDKIRQHDFLIIKYIDTIK